MEVSMADDNLGQFGMRDDTVPQAIKGGELSGGDKPGSKKRGAAGDTKAAKRGGMHSRGGRRSSR
jgi:hypothetical protein